MEGEKRKIEENLLVLQLLEKHLEELKQQGTVLENKFFELEMTKQAIKDIQSTEEVMIPLGSGIYSYGKITDTENVMVEVGAGVVIDKTLEGAKRFVEEKQKEIEKLSNQLSKEITEVIEKINQVALEIEKSKQSSSVSEG